MIIRTLTAIVATWLALWSPAWADHAPGEVHVEPTDGGLWTGVTQQSPGSSASGEQPEGAETPVTISVDIGTGLFENFCSGTNWTLDCSPQGAAPSQPPTVSPGLVAQAFRELPLPPSELVVQPPDGRTLVNFATNFYTQAAPLNRTLTLLGRRVELRIWPAEFTWRFGDGSTLGTTSAGTPYPDLDITHAYRRRGVVAPRVDTTYAAEFRVDGGAWRAVDGTVTIPGDPISLEVLTASPVLVGYR